MAEDYAPKPRFPIWLRRTAWAVGVFIALVVLLVFVLLNPIARHVISSQLDDLGINHEGIGSVDIDLWNRNFSAGPIQMRQGEGAPAQLGSVRVSYTLLNILKKRELFETFTISGVDVVVRRHNDGTITINGIVMTPEDAPNQTEEAEAEGGLGFGVGVGNFAFEDAKLVFEDITGGRLTLELNRLELANYRSWEPDVPGRYNLSASLNGMQIEMAGEATPLASAVYLNGSFKVSDLTLDAVAQFTGPTGLTKQQGSASLEMDHNLLIQHDGTIELRTSGTSSLSDLDLRTKAGETIELASANTRFDNNLDVQPDGSVGLIGNVETELKVLSIKDVDGSIALLKESQLRLIDINLKKRAELRGGTNAISAGADAMAPSSAAPSLIKLAEDALIGLVRETLRYQFEGSVGVAFNFSGAKVQNSADKSVAELQSGQFKTSKFALSSTGPSWQLTAPLNTSLNGLQATSSTSGFAIERVAAEVEHFNGETDFKSTSLSFDLNVSTNSMTAKSENAIARISDLRLKTKKIDLSDAGDEGILKASLETKATSLNLAISYDDPAETSLATLDLSIDDFQYAKKTGKFSLAGKLTGSDMTASASGAKSTLQTVSASVHDLSGVIASSPRLSGAGEIKVSSLKFDQPAKGVTASLASIDANAKEFALSQDQTSLGGSVALTDLSLQMQGDTAVNLELAGSKAVGMTIQMEASESSSKFDFEKIILETLRAELKTAAFGDSSSQTSAQAEKAPKNGAPLPAIHIGHLEVSPGSEVAVVDSSAGEPVRIPISVRRIQLGPINTSEPETSTTIDVALGLADSATIEVTGMATPFSATPGFDLKSQVEGFPLPLVSPFVTKLSGLTVEDGVLNVNSQGKSVGAALEGAIDLHAENFYLREPDKETAARFREKYNVPVGVAVAVLKDESGVIELSLPVSGTLEEPNVDYSAVISKAITGALTSLFPSIGSGGAGFNIEPVLFEPGSAEMTDAGQTAAKSIATVLNRKNQLRLAVCGKGAKADFLKKRGLATDAALPQKPPTQEETKTLIALAQERGTALRKYLLDQGVKQDRIRDCRASYSIERDAPPRAEVRF